MVVLDEPELPHAARMKALPPKIALFLSNARRDISKPLLLTEASGKLNLSVVRCHAFSMTWNAVPSLIIIRFLNVFSDH